MGLRPTAARWFEVLTPCDELARTVEAMAETGHVQIEAERAIERPADEPQHELDEYRVLARRYQAHWPRPDFHARLTAGAPRAIMADALSAIHAWVEKAEALIGRSQRLEAERAELLLLSELGSSSEGALAELGRMASAGPQLEARLLVLDRRQPVPDLPRVIVRTTQTEHHVFLSVLAARAELDVLERALEQSEARRVEVPRDVDCDSVRARLGSVDAALASVAEELTALSLAHRLPTRLADVQRLEWFLTHVPPIDRTRHFALVTGWTSDLEASALRRALDESGVHALIRFPSSASEPPIILRNPPWAKPFEALSRLLGTPSSAEADPSVLLVVLAPVLFGFMFADVGQGAALIVLGFLLRRRLPALGMLIPGGAAAVLFGVLFGSVFGREDLLPALWIRPLSEPLLVLGTSVLLGAAVLTLGFLLSGLEAYWRRAFGEWLESDGALALVYLGLLSTLLHRAGLLVAAAGVLIHVSAPALHGGHQRAKASLVATGRLVERALQLGVNTISFARVGAFALAHAGLCVAIVELVQAAGRVGGIFVFLLGNALVLALEGLVVGIQTTRLVLFEFFARFLRAEGRPFVPLVPPASDEAMTGAHK
jgi:V/A-type H+/Na+-transporting ATPase subunit I